MHSKLLDPVAKNLLRPHVLFQFPVFHFPFFPIGFIDAAACYFAYLLAEGEFEFLFFIRWIEQADDDAFAVFGLFDGGDVEVAVVDGEEAGFEGEVALAAAGLGGPERGVEHGGASGEFRRGPVAAQRGRR